MIMSNTNINWDEYQKELNKKLNVDLSNIPENKDMVIDFYINSEGNWYKKYKSGWLEQGGFFAQGTGDWATTSFTLIKPFKNTLYQIFCFGNWDRVVSCSCRITAKTTTNITLVHANNTSNVQRSIYYACGESA